MKTSIFTSLICAFASLLLAGCGSTPRVSDLSTDADSCGSRDECLEVFECLTLDACIEMFSYISSLPIASEPGISNPEWAVAEQAAGFGAESADRLIPLLFDENTDISVLAAVAIRELERIDPKHLPSIIAALDSDKEEVSGWLAAALGRIDSPVAAEESVIRFLVSDYAPHNQEAYGVILQGANALEYIVEAALCAYGCSADTSTLLAYVLSEMDEEAQRQAAGLLMDRLEGGDALSIENSINLIGLVGELGESAGLIENRLRNLPNQNAALEPAIMATIAKMRD